MEKRYANLANTIGLMVALPALYLFFYVQLPSFHTWRLVETIALQSVITILVALGLTFVIVSAGIDLSVGSVAAFASVAIAIALNHGWSPLGAALLGIAAGTLCGMINGVLITKLRVVPFIVTLGSLSAVRGAAKGISGEQEISIKNVTEVPLRSLMESLGGSDRWKVFPVGVWITVFLCFLTACILRFTRFGRYVVAVGSNEQAARLCGVPIDRVKIIVYSLSGLFAGVAGLMMFSRLTVGDPTVSVGLELDGIAAVVIGGASLSGGEGSIFGSVLGALIMQVLRNGLVGKDYPNWVQEIVTGVIIVGAVAIDRFRRSRAS